MSSNTFGTRHLTSVNNENPIKNIKNNLNSNRKKSALKVLTNTVQSTKKSGSECIKRLKVLPMKKFETENKCNSKTIVSNESDEFNHFDCTIQDKDLLPPSMTCNIGMLSNFFSCKDDDSDWFLEDYNDVMINKIKKTFQDFGEPETEYPLPTLPTMEFPEPIFN